MSLFEAFRLFQKLSEYKSFSKVAESEQVHVSSVSRRIEALEAELGVSLFVRTTRSVSLTPAGRLYLERVQNLLAGFEEAKKESDAQLATPKGSLKIAAPVTFSRIYLAPLLARFHESYPEIRLTLISSNDYVDLIQEEIDLAIRIGNLKDSSLISKRLGPATYALCASPRYFHKRKHLTHPSELKDETCLISDLGSRGTRWYYSHGSKTQSLMVNGPLKSNQGDVIAQVARDGVGIALLPTWMVRKELQEGTLISLLTKYSWSLEPRLSREIQIMYPKQKDPNPRVRAFIDFFSREFQA
jgi:DNA-binding transcriptional LysR family regulator